MISLENGRDVRETMKGLNKQFAASLILVMVVAVAAAVFSITSSLSSTHSAKNSQGMGQTHAISDAGTGNGTGAQMPARKQGKISTNSKSATHNPPNVKSQNAPQNGKSSKNGRPSGNAVGGQTVKNGANHSNGPPHSVSSGSGGSMLGQQTGTQSSLSNNLITVYSILYLIVIITCFVLNRKRKIRVHKQTIKALMGSLLVVALCTRLALAPWISGHMDLMLFQNWAQSAASRLTNFYQSSHADYPPLYIYVLYGIGKAVTLPGLSGGYTLLLKLPSILADVLTAWLIYHIAGKKGHEWLGLAAGAFYLFNPAIWMDSVIWGQVDSFFTLIIVLALNCLIKRRYFLSTALFAASVMMKPQGIIFLPLLAYVFIRDRKIGKGFLALGWYALITALIALPFSFHASGGALWLVQLMKRTISEYPYASVNAFNFFSLIGGNFQSDSAELFIFSYHTWGMLAIVLISLVSLWMVLRKHSIRMVMIAGLIQIAGVFTFATGMHERYLYPAMALALICWLITEDHRFAVLAIGYSFTNFMNLYFIYFLSGTMAASYSVPLVVTSLVNVLLFGYLVWTAFTVRQKSGLS